MCSSDLTVYGPCGALGVDGGSVDGLYRGVFVEEVRVDILNHVGAFLIGGVDTSFDGESFHGVDLRVAD